QQALAESKSVKHLHGATGDPVGLAEKQRTGFLLNYADVDVRECRQLRRQGQPRRSAADDQHVDFRGKRPRRPRAAVMRSRFGNLRVTRSESVEMELHRHSLPVKRRTTLDRLLYRERLPAARFRLKAIKQTAERESVSANQDRVRHA